MGRREPDSLQLLAENCLEAGKQFEETGAEGSRGKQEGAGGVQGVVYLVKEDNWKTVLARLASLERRVQGLERRDTPVEQDRASGQPSTGGRERQEKGIRAQLDARIAQLECQPISSEAKIAPSKTSPHQATVSHRPASRSPRWRA